VVESLFVIVTALPTETIIEDGSKVKFDIEIAFVAAGDEEVFVELLEFPT
jgi:hypothetical protein